MEIINTTNLEQAKKLIKNSTKPIIIKAQNLEFNRKILEYGKFNVLFDLENIEKKDKLKQIDSSLNDIMANIAAKNKISIGINIERISKLDKKQKAIALTRISKNIRLLRKAKADLRVINYKDKKDAFALLTSLGASTKQAEKALQTIDF